MRKWFFYMVLVLCIRILYRSYFPNYYEDTQLLVEIADRFEKTGQIAHYPVESSLNRKEELTELRAMPHGFVYLLWGVNKVTGSGQLSIFFLDAMSIALFVFSTCFFLAQFSSTNFWTLSIWLTYLGITPSLLHPLPSTDLLCLSLLSSAIFIGSKQSLGFFHVALLIILITPFIRYAYLPFPLIFLFADVLYHRRKPSTLRYLKKRLGAFIAVFGLYLVLFFLVRDSQTYTSNQGGTIYVEHLLYFDPFPLKAIWYFNHKQLAGLSFHLPLIEKALYVASFLLSGLLVLKVVKIWVKWVPEGGKLRFLGFLFRGIFLSNLLLIALLSLRVPPERDWIDFWTYVRETRYFAPAQLVLLLTFVWGLGRNSRIGAFYQNTISQFRKSFRFF